MSVTGVNNYTNPYTNAYTTSTAKQDVSDVKENGTDTEKASFSNVEDLMQYLGSNFSTVNRGMVKLSRSYLKECLEDEEKRKELFDNLRQADEMEAHAKENVKGYQGMRITIDGEGKMETETRGGSVSVNEGKRLRQIAAAKNPEQVRAVLSILNQDLAECQNGVRNGMCDENEVKKVKALIEKAMKRMSEVTAMKNSREEENFDAFSINILL